MIEQRKVMELNKERALYLYTRLNNLAELKTTLEREHNLCFSPSLTEIKLNGKKVTWTEVD